MRTREGFTRGLDRDDHCFPDAAGGVRGALLGAVGYPVWGWLGAVFGLVVGYGAGVYLTQWFGGVPLSPHVKGWLSLVAFLGGLTLLAIATR